jgi:hypothetical protein
VILDYQSRDTLDTTQMVIRDEGDHLALATVATRFDWLRNLRLCPWLLAQASRWNWAQRAILGSLALRCGASRYVGGNGFGLWKRLTRRWPMDFMYSNQMTICVGRMAMAAYRRRCSMA